VGAAASLGTSVGTASCLASGAGVAAPVQAATNSNNINNVDNHNKRFAIFLLLERMIDYSNTPAKKEGISKNSWPDILPGAFHLLSRD
jgi:hypothetical protein